METITANTGDFLPPVQNFAKIRVRGTRGLLEFNHRDLIPLPFGRAKRESRPRGWDFSMAKRESGGGTSTWQSPKVGRAARTSAKQSGKAAADKKRAPSGRKRAGKKAFLYSA